MPGGSKAPDLPAVAIAGVVLRASTNRLADLRRLIPQLLAAHAAAEPGAVATVGPSWYRASLPGWHRRQHRGYRSPFRVLSFDESRSNDRRKR
jgi:hypothetical protein